MASKPIAAPGLRCKAKAAPRPAPAGDATDAEPDPESESAEAVPVKAPPPLSPYEAAGLIADIIVCAKRLGRWTERLVHLPLMEEMGARAEAAAPAQGTPPESLQGLREHLNELRELNVLKEREEQELARLEDVLNSRVARLGAGLKPA